MRRTLLAICVLVLCGCANQPQWEPARTDLFKPVAMRIHPVFTQVRDWTGDARADGVELLLEFQDQFGDPAKASGDAVIEVFEYRSGYPDPRGARPVGPFLATTNNVAAQRDHWSRTSRCYTFQLAWPKVNPARPYVVDATFEISGGGRFTDRLVLSPLPAQRTPTASEAATRPANGPGLRSPKP